MVDIDERVVQMKFDNTDFEQKTKKTFSILDKLHEKLSFKDVVDNDAMNSIADNVQKVADKAYTIIDRTIDKIKDNIANKLVGYIHDVTIGQIQMGFNKYADMTTSVATLKAQGYAMQDINEQLERLMYFTDETSFKFTDMVGEIGKFTASGQKLEDATLAMMGIANWASLSGKNATEASRAMYQLSQALGAGKVRREDYKSIQTLNMDTKEFRHNAIEAAVAIGTLKDNLNGSYTTLVGKKANKLSFTINEFADKLTEGEWFTTEVMMRVFSKYSEAVDDIRALYEENVENDPNYTTAKAIEFVQENNLKLLNKIKNADSTLNDQEINAILKRWKQVAKATDEVNKNYEQMTDEAKEQAMSALTEDYTTYLQEYAKIFGGTVEDAEAALDEWRSYVSDFGIKAFLSSQEAKTFLEAIESAKDAASTVWTHIFTTIFGDYNEAKEIWTDLANALYEVFVGRLGAIANIFDYWKTGKKEEFEQELEDLKAELAAAELMGDTSEIERLKEEIKKLSKSIDDELWNGRRLLMQGVEAFGGGLKSIIMNFRDAWDSLFEENESANKLFAWTERFRVIAFKFYYFMHELGETDFYKNIAQGIMNILSPIKMVINVVKAAIYQFIPEGTTFKDILVKISEGFANMTSKLVPSQETAEKLFRIIRGVISVIKLIGKTIIGVYNAFIKPVISVIWEFVSTIASGLMEIFAEIGDVLYEFEEGLDSAEAMAEVGTLIKEILRTIFGWIGAIVSKLLTVLAPVIGIIYRSIKEVVDKIKELVHGGEGNFVENLATSFKNVADRAKTAWTSVQSLADVFNKYSGGTGLSNFLKMIGEMLNTIITKVGVTILSIFGLEEETAKGRMAGALNTLKDIIVDVATIIRWVYTNVLWPVLSTFIEGLAVMIKDLGNQWRSGDIGGVLSTLREIIKTFTSLQLFKMFNVITKVFGSGGLLKLMRNGAKALKGLGKYLGAKAFNEIASGVIKLAIAITMLAVAAAALGYLPEEKFDRFVQIFITFGVTLAVLLGTIFAITLVLDDATFGLLSFAAAMLSIVATVFVFIIAIKKLNELITHLFISKGKDENGNDVKASTPEILIGLISALAPIILVLSSIFVIMKIISALGGANAFVGMALAIGGLAAGIALLIGALDDMIDMLMQYDLATILIGFGGILAMFAGLAIMTRLISAFEVGEKKVFSGIGAGISMAITIAALALVIRMVLIPTLDTLVENADKFDEYAIALALILAAMLGIMGSIALINKGNKWYKFWQNLSTAALFVIVVNYIKNVVVPMLQAFNEIPLNENTWESVKTLSFMLIAIAATIWIICQGIASIISAISKIDFKAFSTSILMLGLVVLGIIGFNALLKSEGLGLDLKDIGIILGTIFGILLIFGLFGILVSKTLKDNSNMAALAKILTGVALIIGVLVGGVALILAEFKLLYDNDLSTGIIILSTFLGVLTLSLIGILLSFGKAVQWILSSITYLNPDSIAKINSLFKILMGIIIAVMAGIMLALAEFKLLNFDNPFVSIIPVLELVGGTITTIMLVFKSFRITINSLIDYYSAVGINDKTMNNLQKIISSLLLGIIGIMALVIAGITIIGKSYEGKDNTIWRSILPTLELIISTSVIFFAITKTLGKFIKDIQGTLAFIDDLKVKELSKIISSFMLGTVAIMAAIITGIVLINESYTGKNILESIAPALEIAVGTAGTFFLIATAIGKLINDLKSAGITVESYSKVMGLVVVIGAVIAALSIVFSLIINALSEQNGQNNAWNSLAVFGALIATFLVFAFAINKISLEANTFVTTGLKIAVVIAAIAAALNLLALSFLMFKEWANPGSTFLSNFGKNTFGSLATSMKKETDELANTTSDVIKEGVEEPAEDELHINSPSKDFKKYGYYIDKGLEQGIKKDTKLAEVASKGLAIATNKAFCKELGIASPSKVFYENGKFVIRGFVNGAQSEYAKNKEIGNALGEGFAESAMDGMSDEFKKLWTDKGMWKDIKKEIEESGIGEGFGESVINKLLGKDEDVTVTTGFDIENDIEDQKHFTKLVKQVDTYEKEIKGYNEKIEANKKLLNDSNVPDGAKKAIQNEIYDLQIERGKAQKALDEVNAELDMMQNNPKKTTKKSGGIMGVIEDVIDKLTGNKKISEGFDSFGDWIMSKISGTFGVGGTKWDEILGTVTGVIEGVGANEKTKKAIDDVTDQVTNKLETVFTSKSILDKFSDIGKKVGQSLGDGLAEKMAEFFLRNPVSKLFGTAMWKMNLLDDETYYAIWPDAKAGVDANNLSIDTYDPIKVLLERKKEIEAIQPNNATSADYKTTQLRLIDEQISELIDQNTVLVKLYEGEKDGYETVGKYFKERLENSGYDNITGIQLSKSDNFFESDDWHKLVDNTWDQNDKYFGETFIGNFVKLLEDNSDLIYAFNNGTLTLSQKGNDVLKLLFNEMKAAQEKGELDNYEMRTIQNRITYYINNYDKTYSVGGNDAKGYVDGFLDIFDWGQKLILDKYDENNKAIMDNQEQNSPSELYFGIGENDVLGFLTGFEETFPQVIKSVEKDYDLLNDASITGLNAMADAAINADNITPTIAPVFDDTMLQSGVSEMNSAVDSISPRVENAIGSFGFESPDYTNNINNLQSRIDNLTGVVDQFMTMIANGAGLTVNVNAEADPTNIYQLVVDVNKQEFKRIGVNNLASV